MHIHNHVTSIEKINQGLQKTLERINLGVFLLDKNTRVVYSNAEATRILESSNAITLGRGGRLHLADEHENTNLQLLTSELAELGFRSKILFDQGLHLAAHDSEQIHPLKLSLIPIRQSNFVGTPDENISIIVLVNDPSRAYTIPPAYLQQAYGLTETENAVVQSLLNNLSINEISGIRDVPVETTRWQLKTIMKKTNTHSQTELSRLLMALGGDFN
jgi:DNA-binding CsgD family transcriptional regulator